jgi:uncharacterized protein YndB with AHSA1/START domain
MDGTLTRSGNRFTVTFERELAHPPEKVWRVITERELLVQWFPSDVEGEWKVGAPLRFLFPEDVQDMVTDDDTRGEVLAMEPNRLLEYSWGPHTLRMEIIPTASGCTFRLSETMDDPSIVARDGAGWEACLANFLSVLETGTTGKYEPEDWRVLFAKYAAKFEPVAGPQQGPPVEVLEERARGKG